MRRRTFLAVSCIAFACGAAGADGEPPEHDTLHVRVSEGPLTIDYGVRLSDLGLHEERRFECQWTRQSPCPPLPVSAAWQSRKKADAARLREHGFDIAPYKYQPAISPDGRTILRAGTEGYELVDVGDRRGVPFDRVADRALMAYEWAGSKGCFVLLTSSSKLDLKPWNWLAAFAGHPVQRNTYWLELRSPTGALLREAVVASDVRDSSAFLVVVPETADAGDAQSGSLPGDC